MLNFFHYFFEPILKQILDDLASKTFYHCNLYGQDINFIEVFLKNDYYFLLIYRDSEYAKIKYSDQTIHYDDFIVVLFQAKKLDKILD